jgi:hypothetical protein
MEECDHKDSYLECNDSDDFIPTARIDVIEEYCVHCGKLLDSVHFIRNQSKAVMWMLRTCFSK